MADEKKRSLMKGNFSANKIPTEAHFHELIDEIVLRGNGLEKLKDGPLRIVTENTDEVLSLHRKFGDEIEKGWSLSLQNSEGGESGLSIDDNGATAAKRRMFIDATGNVVIGDGLTKEDQRLHVKGNLYVDGELRVTGHAYKDAGNEYWKKGTSDMRLKDEIPFGESLKLLLSLRGVRYKWKPECLDNYADDPLFDDKEHLGFIAQDIQQLDEDILSRWVEPDAGNYVINSEIFDALAVYPDSVAFQALTVEAIRELNSKLESSNKNELHIADRLRVDGVIQPSVGNSETNGIMFPKNPGSGGRDAAWIRYYARTGENTILEIGTSNDRADHIVFNASGNIGIGTDDPKAKLHIKSASDVELGKEEGGALLLGDSKGVHLALDTNEIMAKKDENTAGTLYLQNNGGDVSIGGTIKGTVEISSRWGNWLFLKQERATEGGGGFVIHNPWRDGDSSARNGISIAYRDQQGTVNWGNGINFNGPTGKFTIGTDLTVKGVIQPSAGKSEANGIMFPKNPGGGGSDAAWIRYYARSGENTILEIGTSNDRADHIVFNASGNIGIGTNEPKAKLHIKTTSDVAHNREEGGALILGDSAGVHLALDNNEIMAKKNGTSQGTLHLQTQGGETYLGGNFTVKGSSEIAKWAEESLTANGYARVGSLLIQWGTHRKNEDRRYDIKFPKTFSKQCFSVVINRQLAGAVSPMYAINITREKFSIDREDGIHGTQTINWIAVGI
ncbi:MAG: tail fiber domain-containing protein [Candidatus Electrothrix sp. LOE1_4_5]|nr:tail fiber domain-containing protein [Candidatus Electrothrix gigas]